MKRAAICTLINSLFILLLFWNSAIESATLTDDTEKCSPSSCGNLHNVSSPFRLWGDPQNCGMPDFELICEADKDTILYLDKHRYLVLNISSNTRYITVRADCAFTKSTCKLEANSSFHSFTRSAKCGFLTYWSWASFVNCSRRIQSKDYMVVPSLSSYNTSVYVTVGRDAYMIKYLPQFCRSLDVFPFTPYERPNSGIRVTEILRSGFLLDRVLWSPSFYTIQFSPFSRCWNDSKKAADEWLGTNGYRYIHAMFFPIIVWYKFLVCLGLFHEIIVGYLVTPIIPYSLFALSLLLGWTLICRFVLAPLSVCAFLVYEYRKNKMPIDTIETFLRNQQNLSPTRYSFANVIVMTRNFKEKLGKGGFGSVFKGELLGGWLVAVKVLGNLKFSGEDFINEVSTIGRIHHVNIVQLIGFCSEGTKRALVYEYMPNGSLDKYILSSSGPLTLEQLNEIALGIARGIDYLHRGCDMQILHFDIKPHNILLDRDFTPKISDFGLAKMYPREHSLVSVSAARGTIGYIAPELISRNFGVISYKSDVYSFGMLLLDIAGKRRDFDMKMQSSSDVYYPSWIYDQLGQQVMPNFEGIKEITELERKLCKVGLWCIQMDSSKRPSMGEVIKMLEANEDHIEMPPKPFFSTPIEMPPKPFFSTPEARIAYSCLTPFSTELLVTVENEDQSPIAKSFKD